MQSNEMIKYLKGVRAEVNSLKLKAENLNSKSPQAFRHGLAMESFYTIFLKYITTIISSIYMTDDNEIIEVLDMLVNELQEDMAKASVKQNKARNLDKLTYNLPIIIIERFLGYLNGDETIIDISFPYTISDFKG